MATMSRIALLCVVLSASYAVDILKTNEYELASDTGSARTTGIALTPGGDQYVFGTLRDSRSKWKSFRNSYHSSARSGFIHLVAKDTNEYIWSRFESNSGWVALRGGGTDYKGNLYVCGFTDASLFSEKQNSYELWVAKYNMQGERVWGKQFGGELQSGNFYDSGQCGIAVERSALYVSLAHTDGALVVAKFATATGLKTWHYTMTGSTSHWLDLRTTQAMTVDTAGDVFTMINSGSTYSAVSTRDNGFDSGLAAGQGDNAIILKHDSAGRLLWRQFISSSGSQYEAAVSLSRTADNDIIVCGRTDATTVLNGVAVPARAFRYTGWVMRLSGANGSVMWVRYPQSPIEYYAYSACTTDKAGRIFVSTYTTHSSYDHQMYYDVLDDVTGASIAPRRTENPPGGGSADVYTSGYAVDFSGVFHSVYWTTSSFDGRSSQHPILRSFKLNATCACDDLDQTLGNVQDLLNLDLNLTQAA